MDESVCEQMSLSSCAKEATRIKLAHQELLLRKLFSKKKKNETLQEDVLINMCNYIKQQSETVHSEQNTGLMLELTVKNQMTGFKILITEDGHD